MLSGRRDKREGCAGEEKQVAAIRTSRTGTRKMTRRQTKAARIFIEKQL